MGNMSTPSPRTTRVLGRVIGVQREKGYAFLSDAGGLEYFLHRSACEPEDIYDEQAFDGRVLSFEVGSTAKGLRAYHAQEATAVERNIYEVDLAEARRAGRLPERTNGRMAEGRVTDHGQDTPTERVSRERTGPRAAGHTPRRSAHWPSDD